MGMKAVAHLGRLRKAVEGQVRSHKRGNLKKLSSEKSRLQHLMVIVAKDSKNLAKKKKLMAKQFSKKIKHVAKQSIKAIVRERKWRKWLTATLQREVSQTQGHHNKERQIVRGEKTYAHIIQGLKAMIQGEHGLYNKMSKMLHGAKVKKQRLEFFKHEISKKTRQSGKQHAWYLAKVVEGSRTSQTRTFCIEGREDRGGGEAGSYHQTYQKKGSCCAPQGTLVKQTQQIQEGKSKIVQKTRAK